jgi:hypothetical protein
VVLQTFAKRVQAFIEACRDEVGVPMETPRCDVVVGDDADENAGIGEQEPTAWNEDSRDLAKERVSVADMEHDVQGHCGVERAALAGQGTVHICFLDRRGVSEAERRGAVASEGNGFAAQVKP